MKKGLGAMVLADMKPSEGPIEETPMEEVSAHRAAAEEVLQAIELKDASLLEESLKAFYELCRDESIPEQEPIEG